MAMDANRRDKISRRCGWIHITIWN